MEFIDTNTMQVVSIFDIFRNHPDMSFPSPISSEDVVDLGYEPIVREAPPLYDEALFKLTTTNVEKIDGVWTIRYILEALPASEQAIRLKARFENALDNHLDSVAQQRRYDNRFTCALRAGYPGPFQAEGQAFAAWMDTCNATAYQILFDVQQGKRLPPNSVEEFINLMPIMQWPN